MNTAVDICKTLGCNREVTITYLDRNLCNKCKCEIQESRFDGGPKTLAVTGFEKFQEDRQEAIYEKRMLCGETEGWEEEGDE